MTPASAPIAPYRGYAVQERLEIIERARRQLHWARENAITARQGLYPDDTPPYDPLSQAVDLMEAANEKLAAAYYALRDS